MKKKALFVTVLFVIMSIAATCGGAPDEIIVQGEVPTVAVVVPTTGASAPDPGSVALTQQVVIDAAVGAALSGTQTAQAPVATDTPVPTATPVSTATPASTASADTLSSDLAALPVDDAPQLRDTNSQSWNYVFRTAVSSPGQPARYQVYFTAAFSNATIVKMSVDDELVAAYLIDSAGVRTDITTVFKVEKIPTGNAEHDAVLADRFLNVTDGEILPHITSAVWLGDLPAATKLEFFVKDDANLQVNRGLGLVMYFNTLPADLPGGNKFVVDLEGNPLP